MRVEVLLDCGWVKVIIGVVDEVVLLVGRVYVGGGGEGDIVMEWRLEDKGELRNWLGLLVEYSVRDVLYDECDEVGEGE